MMPNRVEIDTFCDMFCVKIRQLTDMAIKKKKLKKKIQLWVYFYTLSLHFSLKEEG